jgi:two-component system cell cycle sensor histidine kinase/response regulator CckA
VLKDVMMPGIEGPEVVSRCRQHQPELGYLYMSGYADDVLRNRGVDPTAGFLRKPFRPDVLLDAIGSKLAGN